MVRLLTRDRRDGTILFRGQLLPRMLLIDHILRFNLFPLQHIVQRRGSILEALYRISEGYWFNPAELIMIALFHFEDKVHRRHLTRAKSTPLLLPRLLCQVLEHIGFPTKSKLERRRDRKAILTVNRWKIMPHSYHLQPPDPDEDQLTIDLPIEEQPPPTMHTQEHHVPASSVPAPLPTASASSTPSEPSAPSLIAPVDVTGPSTFAPPPQYITIFTRDFLTIMDAVRTLSSTSASFSIAHVTLEERMNRTEAAMAQTSAILAQNQSILMQIQSHLSLSAISPSVPTPAASTPSLAGLVPTP